MERESMSDLRGMPVIARAEGRKLGTVVKVLIDPSTRRLAGLVLRPHRFADRQIVLGRDIEVLGDDVVIVPKAAAAAGLLKDTLPGRDVRDLQGVWVTTMDGRHVGTVVDLELDPETLELTALHLSDDRRLAVDDTLAIGPDEMIVSADLQGKLTMPAEREPGLLSRLFGREQIKQVAGAMRRARRDPDGLKAEARAEKRAAKRKAKKPPQDNGPGHHP